MGSHGAVTIRDERKPRTEIPRTWSRDRARLWLSQFPTREISSELEGRWVEETEFVPYRHRFDGADPVASVAVLRMSSTISGTCALSSTANSLRSHLESREAKIAIIGMGSVGLPLARAFVRAGFSVHGFDVNLERVASLQAGESYLHHLGEEPVRELRDSGRFTASSDPVSLEGHEVKILCVPTPLGEFREPDLSYIIRASEIVAEHLAQGELVVLESTTYPGTTRDVVAPILERAGHAPGQDVFLAYSPEREDPGRKNFETATIPKLVGGLDEASGELAEVLYRAGVESVLRVRSTEVAESAKLLENIFRAVNIALVNELKVVLDAMNIDVWEVIEAASSKPFGFMKFTPGPGMGGHCIPIDPFYLTWIARKVGLSTKFIELAGEINRRMPVYVVERTQLALNQRGKAVRGAKILVLGLAYKPDVGIIDESPSVELIRLFQELGAEIRYADPYVPIPVGGFEGVLVGHTPIEVDAATVSAHDAVVIATNHTCFDWETIASNAQLVIDTRNELAERMTGSDRYVKA